MQHSDPFDRVTGRGWVVSGEGDSEILPGTGRGTSETKSTAGQPGGGARASGPEFEGGSGVWSVDADGGELSGLRSPRVPLHHPADGSPPRAGEDLVDPVFTPALKLRFLDELSQHGNVRVAAGRVGVSRSGAYLARRRDAGFAAAWRSALCLARDHAEAVLAERALEGVEEPVFFRGELIATRRRFDSRLLLAHLARLDALCAAEGPGAEPERFDMMLGAVGELLEDVAVADVPDLPLRAEQIAAARHRAGWRGRSEARAAGQAAADCDRIAEELHQAVDAVRLGCFGQEQDAPDMPFEVKSLGKDFSRQDAKAPRFTATGETKSAEGQPVCPSEPRRLPQLQDSLRRLGAAQSLGVLA